MKTLLALSLAGACSAAAAQTPATNPMPDGSRDTYVGLGVAYAPAFQGASDKRLRGVPLLQLEFSNGVFISGMSAGMHLSQQPAFEFGPLLAIHPGRDLDGDRHGLGGVGDGVQGAGVRAGENFLVSLHPNDVAPAGNGLAGMPKVKARLQGGAFANVYLSPGVRLTSTLLYGAGNDSDGLAATFGVQRLSAPMGPHHKVSLSAGLTVVNRAYNQSFFGVNVDDALTSGHPVYSPRAGIKDVYVAAGWNWALSPSWMLTSGARLSVLQRDARHSPLVQRPTNFSVTTGLAYRF